MKLSSRTLNQCSHLTAIFASQSSAYPRTLLACPSKPISTLPQSNREFASVSHALKFKVVTDVRNEEEESSELPEALKQKIKEAGIEYSSYTPGEFLLLICPMCKGGQRAERSLSFHVAQNKNLMLWRCFADKCGWAEQVILDNQATSSGDYPKTKQLTEEGLKLTPLDDELIAYFSERKISRETLERNGVMQISGQKVIAFTYRRDKIIVGCKYRSIQMKRFWQEKGTGTEKILYGLDDIREADEIIVVEGEVDKLSMEEAGIFNCVAVPGGAPQTVSKKVRSAEKDTGFKYVWSCREYFDKASRIILATDADVPGQSLAEELARRLGRERCWKVCWPKRDESSTYKDANEVLMELGPKSLRDVIYESELQPM